MYHQNHGEEQKRWAGRGKKNYAKFLTHANSSIQYLYGVPNSSESIGPPWALYYPVAKTELEG